MMLKLQAHITKHVLLCYQIKKEKENPVSRAKFKKCYNVTKLSAFYALVVDVRT